MGDGERRKQWRGLSELLDDPEFVAVAAQEFPLGADEAPEDTSVSRRRFLTLLGASVALAGVTGCSRAPRQEIVPYVDQPAGVTPSVPRFYATSMPLDGYAFGLLVESHDGRPTKIEGHPEHPATLGGSSVLLQASVLGLYDPNRAKEILKENAPASWAALLREMTAPVPAGKEVHLLLEPTSSPLVGELLDKLRRALPAVRVHYWSPLAKTNVWEGSRIAFGRPLEPMIDLRAADVIVALDSDFLCGTTEPLAYARAFADRRRDPNHGMNRLYVIEPSSTITGMAADNRLRVKARDVRTFAEALLETVRRGKSTDRWVAACARDLIANAGKSIVIVGDEQPPVVHAIAHAINDALGNAGKTVRYVAPVILEAGRPSHGLDALVGAIDAGNVDKLFVLGGNPVYTAFADIDFAAKLRAVPHTAYLGLHFNETARACRWFVPEAHYLESWGDARAFDGTVSIIQPLVEPLYGGRTATEVLAAILGDPRASAHAILQESWRAKAPTDRPFDDFWRESLRRGMVDGTAAKPAVVLVDMAAVTKAIASAPPPNAGALELVLREDARVYDGRFANNAWLLELSDPVTKLTWDNAALVSPNTASRLDLKSEDVVSLTMNGRTVRAPVLILPGHPDDTVSLAVGYGRAGDEALARGVGVDAFVLRTRAAPWWGEVTLKKTGERYPLAITQEHWRMLGREIVMHRTLAEYRAKPDFAKERRKPRETLYQLRPPAKDQWAMTIDVNACTGCSACVVACYAENNIPVVGKGGVRKSREMHWIRIDRYFEGGPDDPEALVQPMLCQHCEKAPCEYVCPVNATVHSDDGLNLQVYNRCVGTRFCSNNCPYKVRRFNWFNYNQDVPKSVELQKNPDVTVRERGVMEKCTFCVQRIREAEIAARRERRAIKDGEIQTACQQACPTRAITFGSIGEAASEVSKKWNVDRSYAVLNDLGTEPRVRYLARIRNPNPEIGEP